MYWLVNNQQHADSSSIIAGLSYRKCKQISFGNSREYVAGISGLFVKYRMRIVYRPYFNTSPPCFEVISKEEVFGYKAKL
jgi:hypothetical protein